MNGRFRSWVWYFFYFDLALSKYKNNACKDVEDITTPGFGKIKRYHGFLSNSIVNYAYKMLAFCKNQASVHLQEETKFFMDQNFKEVSSIILGPAVTQPTEDGKICLWYHFEITSASIFFANTSDPTSAIHIVLMLKFDQNDIVVDEILNVEKGNPSPFDIDSIRNFTTFSPYRFLDQKQL